MSATVRAFLSWRWALSPMGRVKVCTPIGAVTRSKATLGFVTKVAFNSSKNVTIDGATSKQDVLTFTMDDGNLQMVLLDRAEAKDTFFFGTVHPEMAKVAKAKGKAGGATKARQRSGSTQRFH